MGRQPAQPDGRVSRPAAAPGRGLGHGRPASRRDRGGRGPDTGDGVVRAFAITRGGLGRASRALSFAARANTRMAGGARIGEPLVRAALRSHLRRRMGAQGRSRPAAADRVDVRHSGALPYRADARPARGDQRPRRPAGTRRRLPRPVDGSLGQGTGVEGRARAQRRRRLHSVRHGHREQRGNRGRAAPAVRRDDTGQGGAGPGDPAAFLRAPAKRARRPPRLRAAQPIHSRRADGSVRVLRLAARTTRRGASVTAGRTVATRRYRGTHSGALVDGMTVAAGRPAGGDAMAIARAPSHGA